MVVSTVILQAAPSLSSTFEPFKVGFTTTKKIGSAVVRTRVRRRLRAVVRELFPKFAKNNVEYVLIGRYNTVNCPYQILKNDIKWALKKANGMIESGIYKSAQPSLKQQNINHDKNLN